MNTEIFYLVVEHDHRDKETSIIESMQSKYEAVELIQQKAEDYVKIKLGYDKPIKYYHNNSKRILHGKQR